MEKPRPSILQSLNAATRRLLFGSAFAAGLLGASKSEAQTQEQMTPEQKTEFADKLLTEEVLAYPLSADPAKNAYSEALADFEKRLNAGAVPESGQNITGLSVIDPIELDVALALGFKPSVAIEMMAERDGIKPDFFQNAKLETHLMQPASDLDSTRTQAPILLYYLGEKTPQSAFLVPFDMPVSNGIGDLTLSEERAFVNRHESWHLRDGKYKTLTKEELRQIDMLETSGEDGFENGLEKPILLKFYSERNQQESLADVGAAGDMVRAGYGLHIIGEVGKWRGSMPSSTLTGNIGHVTTPSLNALEKKIRQMGVEKFRKLDDASAAKIYMDIVDEHAQSPESLAQSLRQHTSKAAGKTAGVGASIFSRDMRKGNAFSRFFGEVGKNPVAPPVTADDFWDPLEALQQQAFKDAGIVTPGSIIAAYGKLQEKLTEAADIDNANRELHTGRMLKLRKAFIDHLRDMPYADINLKLGVPEAKILNTPPKGPSR